MLRTWSTAVTPRLSAKRANDRQIAAVGLQGGGRQLPLDLQVIEELLDARVQGPIRRREPSAHRTRSLSGTAPAGKFL